MTPNRVISIVGEAIAAVGAPNDFDQWVQDVGNAAIEALCATQTNLVEGISETKLIGLVMTLTGGSANPAVIKAHIERIRKADR